MMSVAAAPVDVAAAVPAAAVVVPAPAPKKERVLGVCQPVEIDADGETRSRISAYGDARIYMYHYANRSLDFSDARLTVVRAPRHGHLRSRDGKGGPDEYVADRGYDGSDAFVLRVEKDGIRVTVRYFVLVDYAANLRHYTCVEAPEGHPGYWRISAPAIPAGPMLALRDAPALTGTGPGHGAVRRVRQAFAAAAGKG